MAQLASVASIAATGVGLYTQAKQQKAQTRHAAQTAATHNAALEAQVAAQKAQSAYQRRAALERTMASVRARAGASGIGASGGSADAILSGLKKDAAAAEGADDVIYQARLVSGRRSLLEKDGSILPYLRAAGSFGSSMRSLLS